MYEHILVPLENKENDKTILDHVESLALITRSRITLLHVADGWAARNYDQLELQESEEMKADRSYLAGVAEALVKKGFETDYVLALGDPAEQIIRVSQEKNADLIAMATHGHKLLGDIIYGSTADKVRHRVSIPVLLLKVHK